jgi:hypothetical protein
MNIKSLLLGSAAALVAVSGARAADAVEVVAEPEPMEYVRVCDTYGAGFFYIPGTETCLRVGGYIRYDIGIGAQGFEDVLDKKDFLDNGDINTNDTYYKRARFALQMDARSETELGTLRGYAQINFNYDVANYPVIDDDGNVLNITGTSGNTSINHAYIELGGFRIGKTDSLFTTFTDYAGGVIQDDWVVPYGPFDTHQIVYTFDAGNGFTAAIGVEEGAGAQNFDVDGNGAPEVGPSLYTLDDYIPHVVAGVGYTGGWGSIKAVGAYDAVWEQFAGKVRVDVKASETLSLFIMGGWKTSDDYGIDVDEDGDVDISGSPNFYGPWGGDWALWGGGTYTLSEKAAINVQLAYDEADDFSAVANVQYELVPGLRITPEVGYRDNFENDEAFEDSQWYGFLRFQRNW